MNLKLAHKFTALFMIMALIETDLPVPVEPARVTSLLEAVLEPGDRVCLEGDNQKQADFLANQLAALGPKDLHDLHLVMSCITLPAHIQLFKKGMVRQVDFCYAGPQGTAVADLVKAKKFPVGAIHTYNELYARYYIDLTPRVALIAAAQADRLGASTANVASWMIEAIGVQPGAARPVERALAALIGPDGLASFPGGEMPRHEPAAGLFVAGIQQEHAFIIRECSVPVVL